MSRHAARTAAKFEAMSLWKLLTVARKKIFQLRNGRAPRSKESIDCFGIEIFRLKCIVRADRPIWLFFAKYGPLATDTGEASGEPLGWNVIINMAVHIAMNCVNDCLNRVWSFCSIFRRTSEIRATTPQDLAIRLFALPRFVLGFTLKKRSVARSHHISCDHAAFLVLNLSDAGCAVYQRES